MTELRPELVGKGFGLIEFLLARLSTDLKSNEVEVQARAEAKLAIVNAYQDLEAEIVRNGHTTRLFYQAEAYREVARVLARDYSGHPQFEPGWSGKT